MAQAGPSQPQPPAQQERAQPSAQQTAQQQKGKTITYATNPERFVKEQTYLPPFNITDPKTAQEHFNVGVYDDNKQQLDKAIEEYQKALELKPDWALAHFRLANDYKKMGRADDAISQWEQATQSDPHYYEAYSRLGLAYKDKGNMQQAIRAFSHLLGFPPTQIAAHYQLGFWYAELGDWRKAREHLESYRDLALKSKTNEPESEHFRNALAELQKLKQER